MHDGKSNMTPTENLKTKEIGKIFWSAYKKIIGVVERAVAAHIFLKNGTGNHKHSDKLSSSFY